MQTYGWMVFETAAPPDIRYFSFAGKCNQRLFLAVYDGVPVSIVFKGDHVIKTTAAWDARIEYNHCQTDYYKTLTDPRTIITEGNVKPECADCLINIAENLYESYLLSQGPLTENTIT